MSEREQIIQFLLQRVDEKDKVIAQLQTAHKNVSAEAEELKKKLNAIDSTPKE